MLAHSSGSFHPRWHHNGPAKPFWTCPSLLQSGPAWEEKVISVKSELIIRSTGCQKNQRRISQHHTEVSCKKKKKKVNIKINTHWSVIFSTKFCTECIPCTENTVLKTDTGWTIFNVNHVHRHKRCPQHSVNVYRISPSQAPSCLSQNHPPQVPLKLLSYSGSKKVKKKKKNMKMGHICFHLCTECVSQCQLHLKCTDHIIVSKYLLKIPSSLFLRASL